jgi:tetratricopeptide (TPR) repeat protein
MLGVVYHAQGRFSDAEEAFETALRLNPRYTEAALNLSVTYNDRGKYDRAREVYMRAISSSAGPPGEGAPGAGPPQLGGSDRFGSALPR